MNAKNPLLLALLDAYRHSRAAKTDAAARDFSIGFEKLADRCKNATAGDERDATAIFNELAAAGSLRLTAQPLARAKIKTIHIAPKHEAALFTAAGQSAPVRGDTEAHSFRSHPWEPELAFCAGKPPQLPYAEVAALDAFLKTARQTAAAGAPPPIVPIKERSLGIFGDEKRLDEIAGSAGLLGGRLALDALRCRIVPEPMLVWKRGAKPDGAILVLENVAAFDTFCRWDKQQPTFAAFVYGGGNRFLEAVTQLPELFAELTHATAPSIRYFGDLDPAGLRIPRTASETAVRAGIPPIRPLPWAYRALIRETPRPNTTDEKTVASAPDFAWLEDPAFVQRAQSLFAKKQRIPQEAFGYESLVDFFMCAMAPGFAAE
jgi:hypothetical protein